MIGIIAWLQSTTTIYTQVNTNLSNTSTSSIVQEIDSVFGPDAPVMLKTMSCESSNRQYDENGDVLINKATDDIGVAQIHYSWRKKAQELGYDIETAHGNILMAKYIFDTQGLGAWVCAHKLGLVPSTDG